MRRMVKLGIRKAVTYLVRCIAQTLPGNHDMLLVFRTVGLTERAHFDGGVIEVTLDLSTLDHLETEAEHRHRQALQHRRDDEHRSDRVVAE